jgi:hypothetical protein
MLFFEPPVIEVFWIALAAGLVGVGLGIVILSLLLKLFQ